MPGAAPRAEVTSEVVVKLSSQHLVCEVIVGADPGTSALICFSSVLKVSVNYLIIHFNNSLSA